MKQSTASISHDRRALAPLTCAFALAGALGCGDNREPITEEPPPPPAPTLLGYGLATDYASPGILSQIELLGQTVLEDVVSGVAASDPVLVAQGDQLIVVNRFGGDSLTVLGRDPLQLVAQWSTGAGSNPQDVARVGNTYYAPLYGGTGVAVFDADAADPSAFSTIDLSGLDLADGQPECSAALAVGDDVLVVCQRLVAFAAVAPGAVARLHGTAVEDSADLAAINPNTLLVATPAGSVFGGRALVGTSPNFLDPSDGCVLAIDPDSLASECVITNADLGGSAIRMAVSPDEATLWVAVNATTDFNAPVSFLVPVDLTTGEVGEVVSGEEQIITDVAACADGYVLATESAAGSKGVRLYQNGVEVSTEPLDLGLPPAYTNALVCE